MVFMLMRFKAVSPVFEHVLFDAGLILTFKFSHLDRRDSSFRRHLIVNLVESLFTKRQPFPELVIFAMIKHCPEIFPAQGRFCIQRLVTVMINHEFLE